MENFAIHRFSSCKQFDSMPALVEPSLIDSSDVLFTHYQQPSNSKEASEFTKINSQHCSLEHQRPVEISFQRNILKQHEASLLSRANLLFGPGNFKNQSSENNILLETDKKLFIQSILNAKVSSADLCRVEQFLCDFQKYENFEEFLKFIMKIFSKFISDELIFIAFQCWSLYKKKQKQSCGYDLDGLIQDGQAIYSQLMANEMLIESSNLFKVFDVQPRKAEKFIQFFILTVLLVMNQYFINPYHNQDEFLCISKSFDHQKLRNQEENQEETSLFAQDDELEDFELEVGLRGRKLRKL